MLKQLRVTFAKIIYLPEYLWAIFRFTDYKPQSVTMKSISVWLNQFDRKDVPAILGLLRRVTYFTEKETESCLVKLNSNLIERLSKDSISLKNIIYVQIHDAGSSSPVMLSMLRDRGHLERKGCHFLDSKDVRGLNELTSKLEQGAIVYVDDFAGSGDQFCEVRDNIKQYIIGNFAEFFLLPCICEEALYELGKQGVEPISEIVHSKTSRPLHQQSSLLDRSTKDRLIEICQGIDRKGALGYKSMATMVVFYRNAPTSTPAILRGCIKQNPYVGIFPRTTDLP